MYAIRSYYGSENIITVYVDHSRFADSRWYTGSGIYRNVKLVTVNKLHIPVWGTFITRITSYNVCYTKLLRISAMEPFINVPDYPVLDELHLAIKSRNNAKCTFLSAISCFTC